MNFLSFNASDVLLGVAGKDLVWVAEKMKSFCLEMDSNMETQVCVSLRNKI